MKPEFVATSEPSSEAAQAVERLLPGSPFATAAYADARASAGDRALLFAVREHGVFTWGCTAFVVRRGPYRRLVLPFLPPHLDRTLLIEGMRVFSENDGIWELEMTGLSSSWPEGLPAIGHCLTKRRFEQYVVHLGGPGAQPALNRNRRRNLAAAEASGLRFRRTRDEATIASHDKAMSTSLARRAVRGEHIYHQPLGEEIAAYLRTGCGELHQALREDRVLSSVLVLSSRTHAAFLSGGTTAEGYECHAPTFLVVRTAEALKRDGVTELNLMGGDEAGLPQFKLSFGAEPRVMETATYSMLSPWKRGVLSGLRSARSLIQLRRP